MKNWLDLVDSTFNSIYLLTKLLILPINIIKIVDIWLVAYVGNASVIHERLSEWLVLNHNIVVVRNRIIYVLDQRGLVVLFKATRLIDVTVHCNDLWVIFLGLGVSSSNTIWVRLVTSFLIRMKASIKHILCSFISRPDLLLLLLLSNIFNLILHILIHLLIHEALMDLILESLKRLSEQSLHFSWNFLRNNLSLI